MLRLAARLPDPLVGLRPGGDRRFDLVRGSAAGRPACRCRAAPSRAGRSSRAALPRRRSGAGRRRRCRSAPGAIRRSRRGGRGCCSVRSFSPPIPYMICRCGSSWQTLDDEAHEVARLLVEAERVQGPEAEGRVADPAVAVVPVALAAGRLRQRGGRRGDDRPGRRVGEALEHQGRALQVDAPGVVGEVAVAQPCAPEVFGRVEPLQRLGGAARPAEIALAPGDGAEAGLVLAQPQPAAARRRPSIVSSMSLVSRSSLPSAPCATASPSSPPLQARRLGAVAEARHGTPSPSRPRRRRRSSPQQRAVGLVLRCRGRPSPSSVRAPTRRS